MKNNFPLELTQPQDSEDMKERLSDNLWVQNRLIDLVFSLMIFFLVVPLAAFHFEGREPAFYIGTLFGFMVPEYACLGLLGIIGLIHHSKSDWRYPNTPKACTIIAGCTILILWGVWLLRLAFFPNFLDCLMSMIWNADPCADVDFEGGIQFIIFLGLPFILIFLRYVIELLSR